MTTYPAGRNVAGLEGTTNLIVQIGHGVAARAITAPAPSDLTMSWSIPGGDDTFSCTIPWPGQALGRPDSLTQGMPVRVVDRRSGEIMWAGRVVDPGITQQNGVRGFRVNAVGFRHDAERIATLKNYIDRDSSHWRPLFTWKQGPMQIGDGTDFVTYNDALAMAPTWSIELPQPQGSVVNTGAVGGASYLAGWGAMLGLPAEAPHLYYLTWSILSDVAASTAAEVLLGTDGDGTLALYTLAAWPTTQTDNAGREGVGGWTSTNATYWSVRWDRTGGTVTQPADHYLHFANLITIGKRYDRYGVLANTSHGTANGAQLTTVTPADVVEDILGTMLSGVFIAGTVTADNTILIDQASWYKGIDAAGILDYISGYDADSYWAVWSPATPDGLPRLDWRKWGTVPRYTLDGGTDYTLAGGADWWANSALIAWERGNGVPQTTRASVSVPAITRIFPNRTRDIVLDLSDRGVMDGPSARTLGYQQLAQLTVDRNSGTASVTGAIMDDATGRLVQPWEIRPGSPVRIGATPQQYTAGLPISYDGQTTFKLSQVTYSASSNSAELSFDGGARTLFKAPKRPKPIIHPAK